MGASHTLYRIWYGDEIVYVGRTNQPLQSRLRGHFFGRPMHRKLDLARTTRIERATLATEADMYVYEVYLINLHKPLLNRDDKSQSELMFSLPELSWEEFVPSRRDAWLEEIRRRDIAYEEHQRQAQELFEEASRVRRGDPERACELRERSKKIRKKEW